MTPRQRPAAGTFESGHVSRVELDNFKSWKGRQTIGPFHNGFTAVIGPNGAGKSNLMDSISFVTGLKAKRLRGDQLRDLIYDADKLAEQENRKMSVSIAYTVGENEVEGMRAGEEIIFTRSVVYSVPGATFSIGRRRVTYEEYEQMFNKLNVLTSARNFLIFQGDVEATAAKSPAELTLLFEQISGSDEFRLEYERVERERDRMEAATVERVAQVKLAKQEKKEAKEQKDVTDRFHALQVERERTQQEMTMHLLQQTVEEMNTVRKALAGAKRAVLECAGVEESNEAEVKRAKAQAALEARALSKAEAALVAQNKSQAALRIAHSQKSETVARERETRRKHQDELKLAKEELKRQGGEVEAIKQQIAAITLREQALQEQIAEFGGQLGVGGAGGGNATGSGLDALTPEQREEVERLRAEADKETNELKSEEANVVTQLETLNNRLQVAKSNLEQVDAKLAEARAERASLQKKRQMAERALAEASQLQTKLERVQADKQTKRQELETALASKTEQLAEAKQILGANRAKSSENKRSKKLQETVQALSRHFPGVRGRLVDLVQPTQKRFALAVDTSLGRHLDSIVVERETTAFECVKYLREHRLGTATFLPLDTLRVKPVAESKRKLAVGPYRLCLDLIDYEDTSVERAVRFAAGDAMICDTLEDARRLCFTNQVRVKAVTLEGHVISPRGEMTGGAMGGEQGGSKQDRFAEAQAQTAKENKDRLEREIAEVERALESLAAQEGGEGSAELLNSINRVKFCKIDLNKTEVKLQELDARVEQCTLASETAKFKHGELEAEAGTLKSRLESIRDRITKAEDRVFEDHNEHVGGGGGGTAALERRRQLEQLKQYELDFKNTREHLVKLESQLRYISSTNHAERVAREKQAVEDSEERIAKLEAETEVAKERMEEAAERARAALEERKRAESQLDLAEQRAKDCQAHLHAAVKEKSQAQRQVSLHETELQRLAQRGDEIVKQAALDGLTLPRHEDEEFDFSLLRHCKLKSEQEFLAKLQELKDEAAALAPNARADVRYAEASERLREAEQALQQSRELSTAAELEFSQVHARRHSAFMEMFTHVSLKIDSVYKELTKRLNSPLGGSAFLALEDEEGGFTGGIKFECMPPNKRYRAMEQLSGGEKTIAALALLFAIHTFRPSPFFVLDEVDAALDNDNVERVSNYIRTRSSNSSKDGGNQVTGEFRPFQCLVISLKDGFFSKAEALVGVYRDQDEDTSRALTLDLSQYQE